MNKEVLGQSAGLLVLLGFAFYVYNTLKRGHKPKRASWIVWSVAACMMLASLKALGAHSTLWLALAGLIGPVVTAVISIWCNNGEPWNREEKICLGVALFSGVVWYFTKQPITALLINLFVDGIGIKPTMQQIWKNPREESVAAWLVWAAGNTANALAIDNWSWSTAVYPLYFFCAVGALTAVLLGRLTFLWFER